MGNPFPWYVEDFEKEAEAFLRKYECGDAIENPQPIPIRQIAERLMSLDIIDSEYLSPDDSVQGAIAFTGGIIEVYDWSAQEYIGFEITAPTIFVDADIINIGRFNNTLAHECFHWWRHRNYFNYKRTHENGTEFAFRCNRKLSSRGSLINGEWSDIDRMEWQAKTIAPKILMPRVATKKKIDELYRKFLSGEKSLTKSTVTPAVIESLATFFEVSQQSAAIRMLELGFKEAEPYCDIEHGEIANAQQRAHKNTKAKRRQQPISAGKAYQLYRQNDFLKATLDTGAFIFADGYFVLNNPRYVGYDGLTDYAKDHLAECTLDFSVKLQPDFLMHSESYMMFRSDNEYREETSYDNNTQNTELYNKAKDFERKLKKAKENAMMPAEWMRRRMEEAGWYEYHFENRTLLDKMTYTRVQSGNHKFTLRPLVAMGVGLGLTLSEMEECLRLGGMGFTPGNDEEEAYKYLFSGFYGKGIDVCNDFLEEVGVKKLGTIERQYFNKKRK